MKHDYQSFRTHRRLYAARSAPVCRQSRLVKSSSKGDAGDGRGNAQLSHGGLAGGVAMSTTRRHLLTT